VVRFAYLSSILGPGCPSAYLTFTCIKFAEVVNEIAVTTNRLSRKVTAAFLGNTGGFVMKKTCNGVLVAGQQQRFQLLLGQ
jgi:hypothetical protein